MPAAPAIAPGFTVTTVAHRQFSDGTAHRWAQDDTDYLTLLAESAGVDFLAGADAERPANTFEDMGTALLADLGERPDPVDLLVLAYATPDFAPLGLSAPAIADRLPGTPQLFGVTDQGRTASFTMLALAHSYARRHGLRRVLALAFDQVTLAFGTERSPARQAATDSAVALVIEAGDGAGDPALDGLAVRQEAGLRPQDVPDTLARLLAAVAPHGASAVLYGAGVDPAWRPATGGARVWQAPQGQPCTALLSGLAGHLPAAGDLPVVLAEYDEDLGDLSVCRIGTVTP